MLAISPARKASARQVVMVGAVALFAACDDRRSPTTPTQTITVTAVHLSGPEVLAPGAIGQLTAIANYSDGTSADVTSQATFRSAGGGSARAGVQFEANGTVRAGTDAGLTRFKAIFQAAESLPWTLLILPPGTFRLHGAITEDGWPDQLGAVVEIVGGAGMGVGQRAQRYELGQYDFFGVAGDLEIRASATGHAPQVHRINVTSTMRFDIDLRPLIAPADVSGAWTMTLTPAAICAGNLPPAAAERTLGLQISQQGGNIQAFFSGPTIFNLSGGQHVGSVLGQTLAFYVAAREHESFNEAFLFDRLGPTQWIGLSGQVRGTVAEPEFKAVLTGDVDLYTATADANFPLPPPVAGCPGDHGLVFRRK